MLYIMKKEVLKLYKRKPEKELKKLKLSMIKFREILRPILVYIGSISVHKNIGRGIHRFNAPFSKIHRKGNLFQRNSKLQHKNKTFLQKEPKRSSQKRTNTSTSRSMWTW